MASYPRDIIWYAALETGYPDAGHFDPHSPARQIGTAAERIRESHICELRKSRSILQSGSARAFDKSGRAKASKELKQHGACVGSTSRVLRSHFALHLAAAAFARRQADGATPTTRRNSLQKCA